MLIGITGGSGSGKSVVASEFEKCGIPVIDSDFAARNAVAPGMPALVKIAETFGKEYISQDGSLLRKKLGKLVFSDKDSLNRLNEILMHYLSDDINRQITTCNAPIICLDAPLLIEYGMDEYCDYIIAVISDSDNRLKRIQKRDSLSESEALNRIKSQNKDNFYLEKADYIVYNNSTRENLVNQTKKIINQLREKI